MCATARVILRVTNVSPRRGDSWLNRMPLDGEHAVALAVIDGGPVGVDLRHGVRAARIETASSSRCGISATLPYISLDDAW